MECNCTVNGHGMIEEFCGAHDNAYRRLLMTELSFQLEKQREDYEKRLHLREVIIDSLAERIEALKGV